VGKVVNGEHTLPVRMVWGVVLVCDSRCPEEGVFHMGIVEESFNPGQYHHQEG